MEFRLTGLQLGGQSSGATYGDDDQMDSNYPIIRMVDSHGNVLLRPEVELEQDCVGSRRNRNCGLQA
ncbi:MAG TPA: hypothetical protein VIH75_10710 [Candidatus Sulfotelmatobacter sp.]